MRQRIIDNIKNIKRHWKLFAFIGILLYIVYRLFIASYTFVFPVVRLNGQDSYTTINNDRATCLTELDYYKKSAAEANAQATVDIDAGK